MKNDGLVSADLVSILEVWFGEFCWWGASIVSEGCYLLRFSLVSVSFDVIKAVVCRTGCR